MENKIEKIRLSPSSINTWFSCPRKFWYSYILKLKGPVNISLIKGNVCHRVLELFFGKIYRTDIDNYYMELLDKCWEEKKEELSTLKLSEEEEAIEKKDCQNMLEMYFYMYKMKLNLLLHIGKIQNEKHGFYTLKPKFRELWLEDTELNLCGYIDRIHIDFNNNVIIGDYKTSTKYGISMKNEEELQNGIYSLLYKRIKGIMPYKAGIIYLRYGEESFQRVTPDLLKMTLIKVQMVRDSTNSRNIEDYPMNESKLCPYCDWKDKCSGLEEKENELRRTKVIEELKKNQILK